MLPCLDHLIWLDNPNNLFATGRRKVMFCIVWTFLISLVLIQPANSQSSHRFAIRDGSFWYDSKKVEIHSGEMHFARIPRAYWRQRLEMLKAMGMNTVATYVFWNYQETAPGVWDFHSGNHQIARFIRIAQQVGLWVILRPGPYACAEWEFGGFPWWLEKNKDLALRTDNPAFLDSCKTYIDQLAKQVKELQITHGGPIIMVQLENEFGSFAAQRPDIPLADDERYLQILKRDFIEAGFDIPFFTADGSWLFRYGAISGVLPGANGETAIDQLKKSVNAFHGGKGPYLVTEFYPGWLDHWEEPFQRVTTEEVVNQLNVYLRAGVSFNFYMAHGGTNFGFFSGANYSRKHPLQPDITSYDYDAPISEAGWVTPKYLAIRKAMSAYIKGPLPPIPAKIPEIAIKAIHFKRTADLFDMATKMKPVRADTPLTFESLNQGYGYVLYRKKFSIPVKGLLSVPGLRDFATVYVNGSRVAVLSRTDSIFSCPLSIPGNATLDLLVENMGRINYGAEISDNFKGITGAVTINGREITGNWEMYCFPFSFPPDIHSLRNQNIIDHPTIYSGRFELDRTGDTFLDMSDWGKGIVFVNGHNLGRYWKAGPQQTLYLPGCWLVKGKNRILIFEQLNSQKHRLISSTEEPVLDRLMH